MIKMPSSQALALLLAAVLAGAAGFWLHTARLAPTVPAATTWLSTPMKDLNGQAVRLDQFKGRPVIINFWATWCAPCIEEMPDFQKASVAPIANGIQFVGIGIDYADKMRDFSKKLGITYALWEAGPGGIDLLKQAGNKSGALPYTIAIDAGGKPIFAKLGKMDASELQKLLAQLQAKTTGKP